MQNYSENITTSGTGYWSDKVKTVRCIGYSVPYTNEGNDFGELRVYFDMETWDVDEDGLIYTDDAFLAAIRLAFDCNGIDYSEQGMQGTNYVSFDVGAEFLGMYEGA